MKKKLIILSVVLGVGLISWFVYQSQQKNAQSPERKILYWVEPMDPNYRSDKPGKSPMGMDLVPVYADSQSPDGGVKISAAVQNNLGVRISTVKKASLQRKIETVGYVSSDESLIEHVHVYTEGWIRNLKINTEGSEVKKGERLFDFYSPTLINAQQEFLLALKNNNQILIQAGEKKLLTLGMSTEQIEQLKQQKTIIKNIAVFSNNAGVVAQLNVREGMFIKPDMIIMSVEDLSHVWINADVFERQSVWLERGQQAIAEFPYLAGKQWHGALDYVYPSLDPITHTLRVRLVFPNPGNILKPNMFADIKIFAKSEEPQLLLPKQAVIYSGDGPRVVKSLGEGQFKSVAVKLGPENEDHVVVTAGLKAGDKVVTSAQFLIDSESNISADLQRVTDPQAQESQQKNKQMMAMAVIKKIDLLRRYVLLEHQAIASTPMPSMEMDLPVADKVDLSQFQVGDSVHLILQEIPHEGFLILNMTHNRSHKE